MVAPRPQPTPSRFDIEHSGIRVPSEPCSKFGSVESCDDQRASRTRPITPVTGLLDVSLGAMRALVWTLTVVASICAAKRATADNAIPWGIGWHCYQVSNEYDPSDRSGRCFRTETECDSAEQAWGEVSTVTMSPRSSGCAPQKKASVVTYFDRMRDRHSSWALPSTALCEETRSYLKRNKDNSAISSCKLVGDVSPPGDKFQATLVAAGGAWFCTGGEGVSYCTRDATECNVASTGSCAKQTTAFAMTWWSSEPANDLYVSESSLSSEGIGVFATKAHCSRYLQYVGRFIPGHSACTSVGSTESALDRDALPSGDNWYCFSVSKAGPGKPPETCFREENSCNDTRQEPQVSELRPTACKVSPRAFVFTEGLNYFALRTLEECKRLAATVDKASRCEAVSQLP